MLPAKQFEVGEVWQPTERHPLTPSSTFGRTSSSSNLARGGLFGGAHGNLAGIPEPTFGSSPDMTSFMLGFLEYDVTKRMNREDLWGRNAFSMGTNAGNHVSGSTMSASINFILPKRWFGIEVEARSRPLWSSPRESFDRWNRTILGHQGFPVQCFGSDLRS
mmetsp:Transcript_3243/g.5668  ORF Transcript_3243/g.5668 Transcript_3243/m.5668 type:complete len:162 (+) Transcript_3243:187-672(+)